ncbi:MAG: hypothetical protein GKR99_04160 [Rhodobacteraceae bacterium]|nr:hypothetical protein [Paracoccaceae bacterium]
MIRPDLRDHLRQIFEVGHHSLTLQPAQARPIPGGSFQQLEFSTKTGQEVRAFFALPDAPSPAPAILYIHAHGNRYDIGAREVLDGRPALQGALGQRLVEMGFAVLCVDLPGFGGRADRKVI